MLNRTIRILFLPVVLAACLFFSGAACYSQSVQTITDRKDILIGEQVKLKIRITPLPGAGTVSPGLSVPDSIPHFDIVDIGKANAAEDNPQVVDQTITFTSFDSGRWVFPALSFRGSAIKTDSFEVNVSYSAADTSNQLRDIKPIISVYVADYTLYYIIGGSVLLLLLLFLLYRYLKKNKKEKPSIPASRLSPYDEAMAGMNKLAQLNLQDAASVKQYHTELAGIFKRYLGRKQQKDLSTRTTGDLLVRMTKSGMSPDQVSVLATALRCTDAVKFAKYIPESVESQDCLQKIKAIIELTEHETSTPKS